MSFRIHAAGTRGFRYTRDNQPDEDIFQAARIISMLQSMEPSASSVAQEAGGYALDPGPSEAIQSAAAVARMTFVRGVVDTVDMLAAKNGNRRGFIAVSPRQTHALWPDTSGHFNYPLDFRSSGAGSDFVISMMPTLTATGFNHYGTFRALHMALSAYDATVSFNELVMITIELTS